jgi:K+/H+ antiporter YhaU regulatory subunit KhtT
MHRAGADFVMSYASMGANAFFNILEGQDVMVLAEGLNVFSHRINKNLAGKSISQTSIRQDTGCTVIAINCEDESMQINPAPDTVLELDREIVLIGSFEAEYDFNEKYES